MLPPILYEDDFLIAFDKPSGLLIAPDRWDKARANLMTEVHARLGEHVANVHRLDADTSGVILCTKDKARSISSPASFNLRPLKKLIMRCVTCRRWMRR